MKRYQLILIVIGLLAGSYVGNSNAATLVQGSYACDNGEIATVIADAVIINDHALVNGKTAIIDTFNNQLVFTPYSMDQVATVTCNKIN